MNSLGSLTTKLRHFLCMCACTRPFLQMRVRGLHRNMCRCSIPGRDAHKYQRLLLEMTDREINRFAQRSDATITRRGSQMRLNFSPSLFPFVDSDPCWTVHRPHKHSPHATQDNKHSQGISSPWVCFTFNDPHTRHLGGEFTPTVSSCLCPGLFPRIRQPVMDGLIKLKDNE